MNISAIDGATMQCPACGRVKRITSKHIGRKMKCNCGNVVVAREENLIQAKVATGVSSNQNGRPSEPAKTRELASDDVQAIKSLRDAYEQMTAQLSGVIVGQQEIVEQVLISVFSRGHVLLTGVPGLAKTLLIDSISKVLDLEFRRIQFTPDLMPADITGTEVLQEDRTTGTRNFQFVKGPIFSNMVLADEINRAPPKTQAALLEAMQERHVSIAGQTMALPAPFFVMATQNPIEQEGTYPLPEAQLDRVLFNIVVDYPEPEDEFEIIRRATSRRESRLDTVLNGEQIQQLQQAVQNVPAADHVIRYARDLVQATRPKGQTSPKFVREMVGWGAGPRAGIALVMSAKARSILHGRMHVTTGDISAVALPVLRHRIATTFHAESAGITGEELIRMLLKEIRPQRPKKSAKG